jgi:hypothetical protein
MDNIYRSYKPEVFRHAPRESSLVFTAMTYYYQDNNVFLMSVPTKDLFRASLPVDENKWYTIKIEKNVDEITWYRDGKVITKSKIDFRENNVPDGRCLFLLTNNSNSQVMYDWVKITTEFDEKWLDNKTK